MLISSNEKTTVPDDVEPLFLENPKFLASLSKSDPDAVAKDCLSETKDIMDMKIADYVVNVEVVGSAADLDYQDALILAMKKQKASFRLYSNLSKATDNLEASKLSLALAKEEARHKLRFELEYDEYYMPEN